MSAGSRSSKPPEDQLAAGRALIWKDGAYSARTFRGADFPIEIRDFAIDFGQLLNRRGMTRRYALEFALTLPHNFAMGIPLAGSVELILLEPAEFLGQRPARILRDPSRRGRPLSVNQPARHRLLSETPRPRIQRPVEPARLRSRLRGSTLIFSVEAPKLLDVQSPGTPVHFPSEAFSKHFAHLLRVRETDRSKAGLPIQAEHA